MGAKDSVKFKLRRPTFKCDMCPKKFLSAQALSSHIIYIHKIKPRGKVHQPNELNTLLGKSVKNIEMAKKSVEDSDLVLEVEPTQTSDVRKIEYECPQCFQCFAVYFSAFRHIQKYHCINSKGIKVPPNSIEMIKPVRIEVCMKCNQRLRLNDSHSCGDVVAKVDPMATYICMGCKQRFNNLKLFNMHVTGLHCDEVETLFFPSRDTFLLWKEDAESQSKVKYLILDKSSNSKEIYHCTYLASCENDEDNVVHFCPSSVFVRDYSKSIQVHFYKQHFGHNIKYKLPDKFKKYKSVQLLKEPTPITEPFELKSLHMDFETLMNFLILESTKCDKPTLEVLHKKAQEMLTVVNNWDQPPTSKLNLTDEQIAESLDLLDADKKPDSPVEVKTKVDSDPEQCAPIILNAFSMATDADERPKRKKVKQNNEPPPINFALTNSPCSSKSSFNDSYKEFVDRNFKTKPETVDKQNTKPKSIETKPVKNNENHTTSVNNENQAKAVNTNGNQSKPVKTSKNTSKLSSPVQKAVSKPTSVKNKKKIVKTKIGQFKRSISPKKPAKVLVSERRSLGKVDFDYEVREQENDCNILVLKF